MCCATDSYEVANELWTELSPSDKGNSLIKLGYDTHDMRVTDRDDHGRVEQMREATASVREILGPEVPVTDKEIQDSLWHYYYDVGKTVTYLLSTYAVQNAANASSNHATRSEVDSAAQEVEEGGRRRD